MSALAPIRVDDLRRRVSGPAPAWLPDSPLLLGELGPDGEQQFSFTSHGCYDCGRGRFTHHGVDEHGRQVWMCVHCEEISRAEHMIDAPRRSLRRHLHDLGHSNAADDAEREHANDMAGWTAARLRREVLDWCAVQPRASGTAAQRARSLFGSVENAVRAATCPPR